MSGCRVSGIVMSADVISPSAGHMRYTLYKEPLDGRFSYSILLDQVSAEGYFSECMASDVSSEEEAATEMFREIADGEVETSVFYDVIYDLLP